MRFQLDPQGEAPVRPPPPAPAPAPPAAAPPPPAPPAPKRRWLLVAGVAALLVVAGVGAGAYVMKVGPFAYPERYLVQKGEEPKGTKLGAASATMRDALGIQSNPGQMSQEKVDELLQRGGDEPQPVEAWAEDLSTSRFGEDVLVFAIKYANEDDAKDATQACGSAGFGRGNAIAMRDGEVVVLVVGTSFGIGAQVAAVQSALMQKSSGLARACAS